MENYRPPLSIIFIWHPADKLASSLVNYTSSLLSRDEHTPFSRSINLPIFYYTATKKGIPNAIKLLTQKTIIFPLIGKEISGDDDWASYIEDIPEGKDIFMTPIALDKTVFGIKNISKVNSTRAYEFEEEFKHDHVFISIAHEIYRYVLNETFNPLSLGKENAIKLFLSHAKDGKNGIEIAKALKKFIDNSTMRSFFDATDIAPGYKFDAEIIAHIKQSTVIAIHSDIYSSRYWCQREMLCAKEAHCPIVAVDSLEEFEDRRFPFAANIPGVHVHFDNGLSEKDSLRIIRSALLETLRYRYSVLLLSQYKSIGWIDSDAEIFARPPEISDMEKIFYKSDDHVDYKCKVIAYPDPPVYIEEISFLSSLNVRVETPLTSKFCLLDGKKIGISIADPDEEELIRIGQNKSYLAILSQEIARYLLSNNATLIYGGDFRQGGFTEFIFHEAHILQTRLQLEGVHLQNYVAWPIFVEDADKRMDWKASNRAIAKIIEVQPPDDVKNLILDLDHYLKPSNEQNSYVWSRCLTEMREKMIDACDVRICAGGKLSGYKGRMPGILEEILIAGKVGSPLFLLGGFGGLTSRVCEYISTGQVPEELTLEWQIENNAGYKKILDFTETQTDWHQVDYDQIQEDIKNVSFNNGLSQEDNDRLFKTPFINEAIYLILKGLKAI